MNAAPLADVVQHAHSAIVRDYGNVNLDDVADELYGLDPANFIEARKTRADQARGNGNRDVAGEITRLRKPTVVAWATNLLVRHLPDELGQFLELGERLRDPQHPPTAAELRAFTASSQAAVRAMTQHAVGLAAERGHVLTESAQREIHQTLRAAVSEPEAAQQVRAGRLVTALSYSGFGGTHLSLVEADPEAAPVDNHQAHDAAREAARIAHEAERTAREQLTELEHRIADLREELSQLEHQRRFAAEAHRTAAAEAQNADRALDSFG